jgi:hypothetical protein
MRVCLQRALPALPVLLLCASTATARGSVTLGAGVDYSTGKYGGMVATDILYLPVYAKYESEPWLFKLTVPWLQVTAPQGTVIVDGQPLSPTRSQERTRNAGLGDVTAAAGRTVLDVAAHRLLVDLVGKVKFPTADEDKGLGTGQYDYALQADAVKGVGRVSLFGTGGYRWMGHSPEFPLNNVWYGSIGASGKLGADTSIGVAYDYREASTATSDPQSEVSAFLTQRLRDHFKVQLYGVAGLSDGSPDWGAGLMLSTSW